MTANKIGTADDARAILKAYEGHSSSPEESGPRLMTDSQKKALKGAMQDGVIDTREWVQLGKAGYSDEFIDRLRGNDELEIRRAQNQGLMKDMSSTNLFGTSHSFSLSDRGKMYAELQQNIEAGGASPEQIELAQKTKLGIIRDAKGILSDKTATWQEQQGAVDALEDVGDKRSVALLSQFTQDPKMPAAMNMRYAAVTALGNIGDKSSFTLLNSLQQSEDPIMSQTASASIDKIKSKMDSVVFLRHLEVQPSS